MQTPDPATVGAAVGAAIATVAAKMGFDKVRGNGHSGVQRELEAHKKDDLDRFGAMTQALSDLGKDVAKAQTDSKLELVREIGTVASGVARMEGQLDVLVRALKKD